MSILAAVPKKTRKISKKVPQLTQRQKIRAVNQKMQKNLFTTPTKPSCIVECQTKMQEETPFIVNRQVVSFNLNYFQSFNPYTLGSINSIVFNNGRFYDLLLVKKESLKVQRSIKCRCSKSKCQAKYCDCFANGQACGPSCECIGCLNLHNCQPNVKIAEDRFCKCSKSGCIKKYCECFQRGDSCSSKCKCQNCKNSSGAAGNIDQ